MSGKHTPGPWMLSDDPVRRVIRGAGPKPRTICIIEDWTTEADAKLMAAAPDAIPLIEWLASGYGIPVSVVEKARAWLRAAGRLP